MKLETFFLEDSLYSSYNLDLFTEDELLSILFYYEESHHTNHLKTLDSFCTVCRKETTFISKESSRSNLEKTILALKHRDLGSGSDIILNDLLQQLGSFERIFNCPRPNSDITHSQIYFFQVKDGKLIKIGQNPSLADIEIRNIQKYKLLDENIYQELNRAVGLSSHGIGVGSFVYLRRIIEKHIVYPILQKLADSQIISQEDILSSGDFKGKIELAKSDLPQFLVENKKIYSILSKGIHELEEQECRDFFPLLKASIEIILDERIEQIEREKKNKIISNELNKFK